MSEAPPRPSFLTPSRWPVRWRLTLVSASLTVVILLVFAAVVGKLTQERLEADFNNELQFAAKRIASTVDIKASDGTLSEPLENVAGPGKDIVCLVPPALPPDCTKQVSLPPPDPNRILLFDDFAVSSAEMTETVTSVEARGTYVQVARDHEELDATISRLWFFLGIGVLGGGFLATFVGLAVAGRAMRPIADLTTAAREIATTRDPGHAMPKPEADDEVAELTRTLNDMLHELDLARSETQGMMKAQREFVADASHELRTPLTSILANLELLQHALERAPRDGEESEMVESAIRSSQRMRRLVGDLLILARADAGRRAARGPCDLASIAEAAADEIRPVAPDHTVIVSADPVVVEGNPDELHRVVLNLISNGTGHTPPGSTINVRVFRRGGEAVVEVADDGPGIPVELAGQVFGRFVRGSGPGDAAADAGTGLGLSIVRAVAEAHGGTVELGRSNHGGAHFTVTLPAVEQGPVEGPKELSRIL